MEVARQRRGSGEPFPDLYAVYADFQTAGRGAGTNRWHSSRGRNILTSIYFETGLDAADQFVFNLWFATATRRFLAKYVPEVLIKWPNDMYVRDRKLAGDLTEHSVSGGRLDFTVAGIGIDVNEEEFPDWIPNPTSLFLETGQHPRNMRPPSVMSTSRISTAAMCHIRILLADNVSPESSATSTASVVWCWNCRTEAGRHTDSRRWHTWFNEECRMYVDQ